MTRDMDKVSKNGPTKLGTMVSGLMENNKEKECRFGKMAPNTMVIGNKATETVMVLRLGPTDNLIKENGKMAKSRVKVHTPGPTALSTKDPSKTTKFTEKASKLTKTEKSEKENGKMASILNG